jgi:hypothetical protein
MKIGKSVQTQQYTADGGFLSSVAGFLDDKSTLDAISRVV